MTREQKLRREIKRLMISNTKLSGRLNDYESLLNDVLIHFASMGTNNSLYERIKVAVPEDKRPMRIPVPTGTELAKAMDQYLTTLPSGYHEPFPKNEMTIDSYLNMDEFSSVLDLVINSARRKQQ